MAMSRHCNHVNIFLGSMIQDLCDIIPVAHMGIYVQSFGLQLVLQILEIILCLPDDLYLGLYWIYPWEGMGRDNAEQANAFLETVG